MKIFRLGLQLVACLALLNCQSSKPLVDKTAKELPFGGRSRPLTAQTETTVATGMLDQEKKSIDLKVVPITLAGENEQPSFSKDGVKILFVSRERPEHNHAQVYELTLNPLRERRVTYHDGDDASPVYHPDGARLLYASTTDSLKNDPVFIENLKKMYSPQTASVETNKVNAKFDLFLSRLDGRDISRILPNALRGQSSQAELALDSKGRVVVFVSESAERSDVMVYPLSGGSLRKVSSDRESDSPKFSADSNKIVWVKNVPKGSQLTMSTVPFASGVALSEKIARHLSPSWHPNGDHIVFSSDRSGDGNLDLFIYSVKTKCLSRATQSKADEGAPVFSPDGKKLAFTSNLSGRNQIYLAEMKDELINNKFCLSEAL